MAKTKTKVYLPHRERERLEYTQASQMAVSFLSRGRANGRQEKKEKKSFVGGIVCVRFIAFNAIWFVYAGNRSIFYTNCVQCHFEAIFFSILKRFFSHLASVYYRIDDSYREMFAVIIKRTLRPLIWCSSKCLLHTLLGIVWAVLPRIFAVFQSEFWYEINLWLVNI